MYKYLKCQEDDAARLNHIAAELLRNTHSIEKGLSIENGVRKGMCDQVLGHVGEVWEKNV